MTFPLPDCFHGGPLEAHGCGFISRPFRAGEEGGPAFQTDRGRGALWTPRLSQALWNPTPLCGWTGRVRSRAGSAVRQPGQPSPSLPLSQEPVASRPGPTVVSPSPRLSEDLSEGRASLAAQTPVRVAPLGPGVAASAHPSRFSAKGTDSLCCTWSWKTGSGARPISDQGPGLMGKGGLRYATNTSRRV